MSDSIRILGIDPGSQVTGYGVVELAGSLTRPIKWGAVRTSGDHHARLRLIFDEIGRIVSALEPDEIAIESVFLHRNAGSALKLGQARAAALCATFASDVPVYEYAPRHIKKALTGSGSAEKSQVQHMVGMILGIRDRMEADAADALAAAVCHAHQRPRGVLIRRAAGLD